MSELAFLSPDAARDGGSFEPRVASPLGRALAGAEGVRDLSGLAKIELRGDHGALAVDAEIVRIAPGRTLLLCPFEQGAALRRSLPGRVYDLTAALAGLELRGEGTMRRLTDLDLDVLPAVGKVAEVPAVVLRDGDAFRLFFAQEYGHYVAEAVLDVLAGLA